MKRIAGLVILFQIFLFSSYGFTQTVTIIEVKGSVQVRSEAAGTWQEARPGMILNKDAELQTKDSAECMLTFDQARKNVLTVKGNSRIKLQDIVPAKIILSEGRVFSLIKAISSIEKFEIKTPTATAGVRGSGLGVVFQEGRTSVFCFEDKIFVQGLDGKGNVTAEEELNEGLGINIDAAGIFGESFALSSQDYKDWEGFSGAIETERQRVEAQAKEKAGKDELMEKELKQAGEAQTAEGSGAAVSAGSLEESLQEEERQGLDTGISTSSGGGGGVEAGLREEERDSTQDNLQEETRREEMPPTSSGGGGSITPGP